VRASQRVATPWASKDYCDYSKHCLRTVGGGSAICFSRTPAVARQYLFRRANGTASSHRQLAAVSRPVSGEAARSGLAEQRAVLCCAVLWRGRASTARQHARQQQQRAGRLEPPSSAHACAWTAPISSLSVSRLFQPFLLHSFTLAL
jgi:hypothetical protein